MRESARPQKPHRVNLGALLAVAGCVAYLTVGSAIVTHALVRTPAPNVADDTQIQTTRGEPMGDRTAQLMASRSPIVVAITVEDTSCEDGCQGLFTVKCTTHRDLVSVDSLFVPASDFVSVFHALGCDGDL